MTLWKNNKSGDVYEAIEIVRNCTNGRENEAMVLYQQSGHSIRFVRNAAEFSDKFTRLTEPNQATTEGL